MLAVCSGIEPLHAVVSALPHSQRANMKTFLRWLKASAVFAAIGAGVGWAFLAVMAVVSVFLWGGPDGIGEILEGLAFFGGFGALFGLGFAGVVSIIGRVGRARDRFPVWKGAAAGAIGFFLAPLVLSVLMGARPDEPLLEWLLGYGSNAWWFAPLGGAVGVVLGKVAERAQIAGPAQPDELEDGGDGAPRLSFVADDLHSAQES